MPDVFDLDSRHPKYSKAAPEPQVEVVEVHGMKCEIFLSEDYGGGWNAEHNGSIRWARTKVAALEAMIEELQIDLYNLYNEEAD